MNKKNKILVGCLTLLLALSVGYALFSDTITINGTATAKGSFDMTATCEVITEETATADEVNLITKGGTGVCEINDDTITTTSTLTKPSDMVYYRITYANSGSIPAVLKSVSSSNNALYVNSDGVIVPGDEMFVELNYYLGAQYGFIESYGDFKALGDNELSSAKQIFQPNDTGTIYIRHFWDNKTLGVQPEVPKDGATINYDITAVFEQVTN